MTTFFMRWFQPRGASLCDGPPTGPLPDFASFGRVGGVPSAGGRFRPTAPAISLAVVSFATASLLAQAGGAPAAVVQGTVLSDESEPRPVPNARVVVFRGFAELPLILWTNDDGRFVLPIDSKAFRDIRVSRSGFIAQFAQRQSADADIEVRLPRAGVVTGRVMNESGEPVWGSAVQLRAQEPLAQGGPAAPALTAHTDDLGEFRFSSINPGRYVVTVNPAAGWSLLGRTEVISASEETPVDVVAGREATLSLTYRTPTAVTEPLALVASRQSRPLIVVSGRVVDQNGRGLSGARVGVQQLQSGQVGISNSDAQGRYEVALGLAGSYHVLVTLPGGSSFEYGQRRLWETGRTITLREAQAETLDIVVPGAGAISGRITDASGEPVEGLGVHPWTAQWTDGRVLVRPLRSSTVRTDDRGRYRVSGLLPGTYYLGISDEVSSSHGPVNAMKARVFYPGGTSVATASPLEVDTGRELSGVDLVLAPPSGTRVIGRVQLSTGEVTTNGQVHFFANSPRSSGPVVEASVDALQVNGIFVFQDVTPGDYVVHVLAGRDGESLNEVGVATVSVGGRETSITVQTGPTSTLAGRVVFEGAPPPASGVKIAPVSADVNMSPAFPSSLQAVQLRPDWTFEIGNLLGPTRIAATAPEGWWLKAVMLDGMNLADDPMTFAAGERTRTDAEVVFVRGTAALTGTASERNRPVRDYTVVVYPTDAALRYARSRYMTLTRSGQDGRYTLSNLPPGAYWLAAVDRLTGDADGGEWQSPELLDLLTPSARRVTLDAGRSMNVDLPLIRLPR